MPSSESAAFQDHFQDLTDPRVERTRKHPLINIVFIAVCGVLSGANSFAGIVEFGLDRRTWFARFLDLTNGIPSDDTFARVLARIDPGAFEKCLLSWMQAVQEITDHRLIAIDGKTLRGSYDRRDGKAAIHMVSAWASENTLSLGQVVVNEKSNEITAIPELLRLLDVSGAVVTLDAMGCQKELADLIREGGGDYVLAVKHNQPTLYEQVGEAIDAGLEQDAAALDEHQTVETGHGRQETRTSVIFPAPETVGPGRCVAGPQRRGDGDYREYRFAGPLPPGGPLLHPECAPHSKGVRRGGPGSLEHRERPALAVGRELSRGRVPCADRSCPGEPQCDPAVCLGAAEARDQLPTRD